MLCTQILEFRNIVYDPETLGVRLIDIAPIPGQRWQDIPQNVWRYTDGDFAKCFEYEKATDGF